MVSAELLQELRGCIEERRIEHGIRLLERERERFEQIAPGLAGAGLAIGYLAEWVDLGFEDDGLLTSILARFDARSRQEIPLSEYLHIRLAEALIAMRQEELP